jgi:hypothetical protein
VQQTPALRQALCRMSRCDARGVPVRLPSRVAMHPDVRRMARRSMTKL